MNKYLAMPLLLILGIPSLVVHPGAHLGAGRETVRELVAESLDQVLANMPKCKTRVLLENTAGQGTLVGSRLEELASIRAQTTTAPRIGICIDTCHAFAAGYAIDDAAGYREFLDEIRSLFGPQEPGCLHLNDSRYELVRRRARIRHHVRDDRSGMLASRRDAHTPYRRPESVSHLAGVGRCRRRHQL